MAKGKGNGSGIYITKYKREDLIRKIFRLLFPFIVKRKVDKIIFLSQDMIDKFDKCIK